MMSTMVQAAPAEGSRAGERQQLLASLLDAVKECQARFGGRAELATESDARVAELCTCLEDVLSHGLRSKPLTKNNSTLRQMTDLVSNSLNFSKGTLHDHLVFWHCVRDHLTRHELERYLVLKQVWTDLGRGRAWLRSALNEHSLERYLHCLLGASQHLAAFYEDWAFLLDQERSATLPNMAAGLGSILFAISIDNPHLNQEAMNSEGEPVPCPEPVIPASQGADASGRRRSDQRRRRRVQPQLISFDDTEGGGSAAQDCVAAAGPLPVPGAGRGRALEAESPQGPPSSVVSNGSDAESMDDPLAKHGSQERDCARPRELLLSPPGAVPAPAAGRSRKAEAVLRMDPRLTSGASAVKQSAQTLTPVNNMSVGELIPVTLADEAYSEEDSLSVPSYSEDTDCAAAALLATQRLLQTNCLDFSPQERANTTHSSLANPAAHVAGEMREALLTVLALKEELQAEARSLRKLLDQAEERSTHLEAELTETGRLHAERTERLEARVQSLARENELLKHQLRKYVGAVQMLKRDGSQAHEALASLEAAQPKLGEVKFPDYHHEAREYEKKLIQVAEMHGELMEFNERLHRLLQLKDTQLRRLREELVDLRGPLPDDAATSDDDVSITSDYDTSSLGAAARALINIWIPSAFLTGGSSDVHHVYQVFIRIRDDEWNIYRRYAQFYSLHKELKKQDSVVSTFDFPPKKTIGNKDARFVEERRRRLQHYLRCVVNHLVQTNAELATNPDKELLVGLMPFFGETCYLEDKSRRKRASSRNPFSRLRPSDGSQAAEPSPQYQGL